MNRTNVLMRFFLLAETVRYLVSEVLAGRTATYGLRFEEYLANNVLAGKYKEGKLAVVLKFILHAGIRRNNAGCIDIVVRCHPTELPLKTLSCQMLLRLRQYSIAHSEPEYAVVMQRLDTEIERRRNP
jgi:hypothetical protein